MWVHNMGQSINLSGLKVSHLMSTNVIFISEEDSVAFAIKIFSRCNISGAPVVNRAGEYVGVVSKTDLFNKKMLEYLGQNGNLDELPVKYIMNPNPPMMLEEHVSVEKAAEVMLQNHIHRIFVSQRERIIGVVSSYDILKVVAFLDEPNMAMLDAGKEDRFLSIRAHLHKKSNKPNMRGV